MKKGVLIKGVLLLILLALLTVGFAGCTGGIIIPTTGTVYITVSVPGYYDIWVDNYYQATTNGNGKLTLTDVPMGSHFFEANGYDYGWYGWYGWNYYYGSINKTIYAGTSNNVTIPVSLY